MTIATPFPSGRYPTSISAYRTVTPLTYRDGSTLLELFSALRAWLENDVVPNIEKEVDRLVNASNDLGALLDDAVLEAQVAATEAATSAAGVAEILAESQAVKAEIEVIENIIRTLREQAETARTDAVAAAERAETSADYAADVVEGITVDSLLTTLLKNVTSAARVYLDSIYEAKKLALTEIVFVGNSNVLANTGHWPQLLSSSLGLTMRNYAIGGQAINNGQYLAQLQAARTDPTFQNNRVSIVVVADLGNDIRAKLDNVDTFGPPLLAAARDAFPNARLVVLPVLWPANDRDAATVPGGYQVEWHQVMSTAVTKLRALTESYQGEFVDDSWTWFQGLTGTQVDGEVHFTLNGHSIIARKMFSFIKGDADMRGVVPWVRVTPNNAANYNTGPNNGTNGLLVTRDGAYVTLAGQFVTTVGSDKGWTVGTIPLGYRPGLRADFMALWNIADTMNRLTVHGANGSIVLGAPTIAGEIIVVNKTWRIDG